jgi:hypothetical protein
MFLKRRVTASIKLKSHVCDMHEKRCGQNSDIGKKIHPIARWSFLKETRNKTRRQFVEETQCSPQRMSNLHSPQ